MSVPDSERFRGPCYTALLRTNTLAVGGGAFSSRIRVSTPDEGRMQPKQNVPLYDHLALATLFQPLPLPIAIALLTAEDVAADSLVEHAESVGHEVADVGEIEERQRNAKQSVDDGYNTTQRRLRGNVTVTYHNNNRACK